MEMTEQEIVSKYIRNGKDRRQIGILADLNGTSRHAIIEILVNNNVMEPVVKKQHKSKVIVPDETIKEIIELRQNNVTIQELTQRFGYSTAVIRRILKEAGVVVKTKKKARTLKNIQSKSKKRKPATTSSK